MAEIDPRVFGALERDVKHLSEKVEKLEQAVERLEGSIDRLSALLDQARGARWVLAVLLGIPAIITAAITAWRALRP